MAYDPNQPRYNRGAPLAGAWSPDNVRGGAVAADGVPRQQWVSESARDDWGEVSGAKISRSASQWGGLNEQYEIGQGITEISCAGHGGVILSPERNRLVPAPLRQSDGIYEEDCDAANVRRTFPEAFTQHDSRRFPSAEDTFRDADASVQRWSPDAWEEITGLEIPPGVSRTKDEQRYRQWWEEAHGEGMVTASTTFEDHHAQLAGETLTVAVARRSSDQSPEIATIPTDEYKRLRDEARENGVIGVPIPKQYRRAVPALPVEAHDHIADKPVGLDRSKLTPAGQKAADKLWRFTIRDGDEHRQEVMSMGEYLEQEGVVHKRVWSTGDKIRYSAELADGTSISVGKSLYNAIPAPHDADRDELERLELKTAKLEAKFEEYEHDRVMSLSTPEDRDLHQQVNKAREALSEARVKVNRRRDDVSYRDYEQRLPHVDTDNYFAEVASLAEEAKPHLNTRGQVKPDAPIELRQKLSDLRQFGRDHNLN